jgi:hypothetical protein
MTWCILVVEECGDDVVHIGWLVVDEYGVDTCHWVAYNRRTRGPIQGCHMSLIGWLRSSICKMLEAAGFDPRTSVPYNTLPNSNNRLSRHYSLTYMFMRLYLI